MADLFGDATPRLPPAPHGEALEALARRLPATLRLGTSSWTFPGWAGLVYGGRPTRPQVVRDGLHAYARHPLFRVAGVDRGFYAPLTEAQWRAYREDTDEDHRFAIKLPRDTTVPVQDGPSPRYLDPHWVTASAIEPALQALGPQLGPLLLQFPPRLLRTHRHPEAFAEALHRLLEGLPRGPRYAVEIRDRRLITRAYGDALADTGALHCVNVYPGMPLVPTQVRVADAVGGAARVVRWILRPNRAYEEAKAMYRPFDRRLEPDPRALEDLARALATWSREGREVVALVGNKAEGSAPCSVRALAAATARLLETDAP